MSTTGTAREVKGAPSTARTAFFKSRYLNAPLVVDIEYVAHLTDAHRASDGRDVVERRADDHAYALERLTPVIHAGDRIVGNKTRHLRGAVPYANYAAGPFLRELRKQEQDAQQKHIDQGHGGGIAQAHRAAEAGGFEVFSGKFLITPEDRQAFTAICEYWDDKCMMAAGDRLWKQSFPGARFIEDGWAIGLYTAPHDPCPEGRLATQPLADGVTSPFPGTDTHGPTAVIRSSRKVDHTQIRGGLLNLKFHPTALAGEQGARNLLPHASRRLHIRVAHGVRLDVSGRWDLGGSLRWGQTRLFRQLE